MAPAEGHLAEGGHAVLAGETMGLAVIVKGRRGSGRCPCQLHDAFVIILRGHV